MSMAALGALSPYQQGQLAQAAWANTYTSTTTTPSYYIWNSSSANTTTITLPASSLGNSYSWSNAAYTDLPDEIDLRNENKARTILLADGTIIKIDEKGSFTIDDKDAKTVYKGHPVRDFNAFINASDKLEEFIKYCGDQGVRSGDMLSLPIELFVKWLVIESARQDGYEAPEVLMLPDYTKKREPRCNVCGRFMSKRLFENRMEYCRPVCYETKLRRLEHEPLRRTSRRLGKSQSLITCQTIGDSLEGGQRSLGL